MSTPFAFDTEFDADGAVVRASAWKPVKRSYITGGMLRLELHIAVMHKAKPLHISKDCLDMLGSTARPVNILNAKVKLTTKSARKFMGT